MNKLHLLLIWLMTPLAVFAQVPSTISRVDLAGIPDSTLSADLRDTMQKLVGQQNAPAVLNPIVQRIETEHPEFVVATRTAADGPNRVRLTFVVASKTSDIATPDANVNSQYTVESVEVKGLDRNQYSSTLYDEMQTMVGQRLDNAKVQDLRARLRKDPLLKGNYTISDKIARGSQPEHVKLVFEATKQSWTSRKFEIFGANISYDEIGENDTVESVEVKGIQRSAYPDTLYADIQRMVGKRIDKVEIDHLKEKLEAHLKNRYSVNKKFHGGTKPETVAVVFDVREIPWIPERTVPDVGRYHPKQGISLFLNGEVDKGFTFGAGTDGDSRIERYKGFMAGFETQSLGTRYLGAKIDFDTFGILWKRQTLEALQASPGVPGAYRKRQAIEPSLAFAFNRTLSASAGLSFTELQMMLPTEHWESAHEATASLRYQSPNLKYGKGRYEFTLGYEVRTATRALDSDFVYTRHLFDGSYEKKSGKMEHKVSFLAGTISGNPPLFERFSLGNTETLRGWNKYDIDPLGGTRVVHVSTEWSYDDFGVFMDNGGIWTSGRAARNRTSLGVSFGPLKLAFPIRCSNNCGVTFMIHLD